MPDNNEPNKVVDDVNEDTVKNKPDTTDKNDDVGNTDKTVPLATFLETKNKLKELSEQLEGFKSEQQKQKEAKLKEEGKLKELLEEKEAEIQRIKAELEKDALAYREILEAERKQAKEILGDDFTEEELSVMPLNTLRKFVSIAQKKETPGVDSGGGSSPSKLTDTQKAEAQRMGLSEEGYKLYLEKRKKLKGE